MELRSYIWKVVAAAIVWAAVLIAGCGEQPGETVAEGRRRHLRKDRIDQQSLRQDIDRVMLYEEPSPLTDKRFP